MKGGQHAWLKRRANDMKTKMYPLRSFTVKFFDGDDVQLFASFVKMNMRCYKLPVTKVTKASGVSKSWFGKKSVSKHLPPISQVQKLAKAVRMKVKIVFGTPKVAGLRTYRPRYEAYYHMKVVYMPRKFGEVQIWYKDDAQIKDALRAVVLEVMEESSASGWTKRFKRYAEEIDRFDSTWYSRIHKICDDLDVTVTISF